jgi:hypothetical protein
MLDIVEFKAIYALSKPQNVLNLSEIKICIC